MKSGIQLFQFEANDVRVIVYDDGNPWWVAKDVCDVLGMSHITESLKRVDEDDCSITAITDSIGRQQDTRIINESGLYSLILQSRKPEAKRFKKWVTSEVLPSIRKTGSYSAGQPKVGDILVKMAEGFKVLEERQFQQQQEIERIKDVIEHNEYGDGFFTILGYCRRVGLSPSLRESQKCGKKAKKLSKEMGYSTGRVKDHRYGHVGTYHMDVLDKVFDREIRKMTYPENRKINKRRPRYIKLPRKPRGLAPRMNW